MSFQDSAVIFFIALLLFGPKKLPELARQIGRLMGEFRRASNDFRMQMEDELRIAEQAERQKQIAAIEAAAPATAAELPAAPEMLEAHPHEKLSGPAPIAVDGNGPAMNEVAPDEPVGEHTISPGHQPQPPNRSRGETESVASVESLPIATSGDLAMMPPATGLPVGRTNSGVAQVFESVPQAASTARSDSEANSEAAHHG